MERRPPGDRIASTDHSSPMPPEIPDHKMLRRIGSGSYGEVWLACNALGIYRAVKVVHRKRFEDDRPYDREFSGIEKFEPVSRSHEGLVDILQVGRNDNLKYFYYVMELADDASDIPIPQDTRPADRSLPAPMLRPESYCPRTLGLDIERHGRLPVSECVQRGLSLSIALEHLHNQGLVHRDIKPSNVIFVNGTLKLADIG